ncbi:MAG: LuxR C-terminal-related transcriptional regulator [Tannerella sp.]|jgi:DNA-binding NarL/FixJ family response regulator|nr:LuxR C-terminal-related transcriptional regulator [Tannerella sp.]
MTSVYVTVKSKKFSNDICLCVNRSGFAKVTGTFASFKDCKKRLSDSRPDILMFALDLTDGYWAEFCEEMRDKYPAVKILAVINYNEYHLFKNGLNALTSGYISKDALPSVFILALRSVLKGDFFMYDKLATPLNNSESNIELLLNNIQEIARSFDNEDNNRLAADKMTRLIELAEEYRLERIIKLLKEYKDNPEAEDSYDYLKIALRYLLLRNENNWSIANILDLHVDVVRFYRFDHIVNVRGESSMVVNIDEKENPILLNRREHQILQLLAAGFSYKEIAYDFLFVEFETVNSICDQMRRKFKARSVIDMIIKALRIGLIKLEDIDSLRPARTDNEE